MRKEDQKETIERYNERLKKFGYSEKALGWSRDKNDIRFEALIKEWHLELDGARIADFGCGFGDLYGFLKTTKGLDNIDYTGIDINENLINIGRTLYPTANFWIGDIIDSRFDEKFDFVLSSGVFNHKLTHSSEYQFIEIALGRLNELASKGFAINFLSDQVDYQLEHTFHSNPAKILEFVYKYSRNVVLRNDYMPFEFTVYVRKDIPIDKEKVVFENTIKQNK